MNSKKLAKEDIESIKNIQDQFAECTNMLGLLQIDENALNTQLTQVDEKKNEMFNQLNQLRSKEQDLIKNLQEKYGQGQINLQEGTFTPNN
ncbi:MAG: hypothetical protein CML17_03890 [Pusillimonas sp.]|mgnify:FL=1|nr:hypothetical protein [Pusillimonas sp.]|tara:strand:+ start:146 stop:418 length:273 start_codon:yes stop_codon:yes gene_type:complete